MNGDPTPVVLGAWSIVHDGDRWTAPEAARPVLHGIVIGHPELEDGTRATTTSVRKLSRTLAVTQSGRIYRLGRPDETWLAFLRARRRAGQTAVLGVALEEIIGDEATEPGPGRAAS
jgi:hypothetical protein